MANTNYQVGGLLGAKFDRTAASPEFTLGQTARGNGNKAWVYVGPAANAITAAATCTVTGAFAVNNTAGNYTAPVAFSTGDYGWVFKTAVDV